jgi:DNA-binding ferritin-like protein
MPNALDGLGESISRMGKGLTGAANSIVGDLTRLQMEHNEADYAKAMTEFEADVDKQVDALKDRTGFAAAGTPEAVNNIYEQAMAKHGKNLRGSALDRFRERALSRRNAQARWGMDYERSQLTQAENKAFSERFKGGVVQFRKDLDPSYIANNLSDYDDMKRRTDKYGQLPTELLETFDKNYDREKGTLKIPDKRAKDGTVTPGKTLVIGKDITKERVEQIRDGLVKHKEAYENERRNIIDAYVASGVEGILESGDVYGAGTFFAAMEEQGYRVSDKANGAVTDILNKHFEAHERNSRITTQIDMIGADSLKVGNNTAYSAGGRYLTPELEAQMTEYLTDLQRKAESGDPDDVKNFKTASTMWSNRKRLMEQQENADYAAALKNMLDNGKLNIDKIDGTLDTLRQGAPTAVTTRLYETVLKQKAALERKVPQKDLTMIKNLIYQRLADPSPYSGFISVDEQQKSYNLKDEKDRHAVMLYYGFDKSQIQAIDREISQGAYKYTSDAAHTVAEVLNSLSQTKKFTPENVLSVAAPLVTEAMSVVSMWTDDPTKYKKYTNEMKQHLLKLCVQLTAEERRAFWFDKDYTTLSYLEQGIGEDGRAVRDENGKVKHTFDGMVKSYLTPEGRRIFNMCRAETEAFARGKIWHSDAVPRSTPGFRPLPENKEAK